MRCKPSRSNRIGWHASLWEQLETLQHQIAQLNRAHFGVSSWRLAAQAELFDATTELPVPPEPAEVPVAGHTRKGGPALSKDLPRKRIEYDLGDEQKAAFDALERIGEERSETLHYEPSRLTVIEHIRFKYAAKKDGESTIVTASAQPSPLPKSNAGASLLANILVNTYVDHLPLNRQEMRYARRGVHLPRATLCEWKLAAAELLEVLLPPLRSHQLRAPRMHVDDTTLPLLEKGRKATRTARLWGYLGTKVICRRMRTVAMVRSRRQETSSRSDAGPIAADASSKSRRRKANLDLQRRRCNGSPDSMRSSRGSRTTRPTSNMRRGKPRRCRCSRGSGNGWRATSSVC
ncbi:MAG TPA: transposase [Paraburkholderia sp.]|nr:transposase [Paraburkholderia sp.]